MMHALGRLEFVVASVVFAVWLSEGTTSRFLGYALPM